MRVIDHSPTRAIAIGVTLDGFNNGPRVMPMIAADLGLAAASRVEDAAAELFRLGLATVRSYDNEVYPATTTGRIGSSIPALPGRPSSFGTGRRSCTSSASPAAPRGRPVQYAWDTWCWRSGPSGSSTTKWIATSSRHGLVAAYGTASRGGLILGVTILQSDPTE